MLESSVLHQGRGGRGTGDGDAVGISWKAPTKSHPSPSLVVTCAHQVVVYQVSAVIAGLILSVPARYGWIRQDDEENITKTNGNHGNPGACSLVSANTLQSRVKSRSLTSRQSDTIALLPPVHIFHTRSFAFCPSLCVLDRSRLMLSTRECHVVPLTTAQ